MYTAMDIENFSLRQGKSRAWLYIESSQVISSVGTLTLFLARMYPPTSWPSLSITLFALLTVTTTFAAFEALNKRSSPQPAPATNLTAAIPLYALPTTYPLSLSPQNPVAENQIRDTLAHYPLAIGGKNFAGLDLVFTPDVVANYSEPLGVLTGLSSVISTLEASLAPVTTQHALSTQVIEILEGGNRARSDILYGVSFWARGSLWTGMSSLKRSTYLSFRLGTTYASEMFVACSGIC